MNDYSSFIDKHKIINAEPTACYVSEFITPDEEKYILNNIYAAPKPKWTQLSNRRLQNWGGIPHNKGMIAEDITGWLQTYLDKIHSLNLMEGNKPNHVLVNEYLPEQGILPHLDGFLFYPTITTISVGSHTVLKFFEPSDNDSLNHVFSLLLEPRSLLILQDEMFKRYLHGIEEVNEDIIDDSIVNINMCSDQYVKGTTVARGTRVSSVSEDSLKCGKKPDEAKQSSHSNEQSDNKKGLVLGVYEEGEKFELTSVAEEINQKSGGKICKHLNEISCHLKLGKAFVVTDILEEFGPVAIASLGKKSPGYNELEMLDETRENLRVGVGVGVRELVNRGCDRVYVDGGTEPDAAAEAAHLAAWRFEEFKSSGSKSVKTDVFLQGSGEELWKRGTIFGSGQNWARHLTDMPPNKMTPVDFAQAVLDMLCPLGVRVTAHDPSWIEAQHMEALLSVARGSCEPAVFLECEYRAGGNRPPVLLAAKGITFDSGGLCLKKADELRENPDSRAGAAATVGALKILAEMKVPINVVAVIPLCESMVSGSCMKVGDVLRALNGLTMQVECTAQAGRLTLADALVYGQAKHRPSLVIDLASLTKGVQLATGSAAFGVFSSSGEAWTALAQSAARAGDRGWRLPLWTYYRTMIDDDPSVDLRNRGPGTAAPCVGAAFLKNFVCAPWLHLDVSGVSRGGTPYLPAPRAAGRPARTLAEFLTAAGTASANVKDSDSPATS
ncbi:unnamed protein product [Danaus chrysippus]|uniref:Cytosol aminopeptidase n=1 Tax=Danaus chrysippus TaxID=151541 RepID=A0A8J2QH35_9NEOP|nr:unnamed protein product [Danaus chrysippus]